MGATVNRHAAGSNPATGAKHGAVVYWLGCRVLNAAKRDRYPPALPNAHVALLFTKQDKGNRTENAGSNPAVCSNNTKDPDGQGKVCKTPQASSTLAFVSTLPSANGTGSRLLNGQSMFESSRKLHLDIVMEGQPARCRRSLLRMRHWQRCGDRVAGLPRGRGVTATCLASNQRSPGQHRASAPAFMLRWCNGQHLGPSNRRRRIETVTEYQCDAAPPARSPAFDAGQLGSTPRAAAIPILPAKTRFS
jgi:hypothetical protein